MMRDIAEEPRATERYSKLRYFLHSGKNPKAVYFIGNYARRLLPGMLFRVRLHRELAKVERSADRDYILRRADYYNRMSPPGDLGTFFADSVTIGRLPMTRQKVYWFDTMEYARWFAPYLRLVLLEGDITWVPAVPSLVKSRPIAGDNANSVLLNMDKVRHFIFINDRTPFRKKKDMAIFRGKIDAKPNRISFVRKFWGNARFDIGVTDNVNALWQKPKLSIYDQLRYRYIMALEGNDVASNLKWIMSSNSVAVMPRPRFETWFMEGTLIPGYHYIEVRDDFSDVEEKLGHYSRHPEEAEAIIKHANEYVAQFRDKRRERLVSLLVLDKYFSITNSYKNIMNHDRQGQYER